MNMPWWTKLMAKTAIGVLPISYEKVRSAVTGYHGEMDNAKYANNVFKKYIKDYSRFSKSTESGGDFLELGPGGSLLSGIHARMMGFDKAILVDVGDFAVLDFALYRDAVDQMDMADRQKFHDSLQTSKDLLQAFRRIGVVYLTGGLASLRQVPAQSVSFSFSNAVLEHVRREEYADTVRELHRIHRKGSISAHHVDYKDHLGGSLNHLRFSHRFWESRFFTNQGFYTNRLRHGEVIDYFVKSGFLVEDDSRRYWDTLPLARRRMARDFHRFPDRELRLKSAHVVFRKKG